MKKLNKIKLYAISFALISLTSLSGCSKQEAKEIPKPVIADKYNNFSEFTKIRMINNVPTKCYKGENIAIAINNENGNISEYIYSKGFLMYECYELATEDLICWSDGLSTTLGEQYYLNIINNSTIVNFIDINDYIENETCKEWYTLEEIKSVEPLIKESALLIKEAEDKEIKTYTK